MASQLHNEEINQTPSRKGIIFFLLISLNIILLIFFFTIPYDIPETTSLTLNDKTLIDHIVIPQFQNAVKDLYFPMSTDLDPYVPNESYEEWKKENPLYLLFPYGKARLELTLCRMETNNPRIAWDKKLILDTLYPGAGVFGHGILDTLEEKIFFKDSAFYYFKGNILVEKFIRDTGENLVPTVSKIYDISQHPEKILIRRISGDYKEFAFDDKSKVYYLSKHYDEFNNSLKYQYDDTLRLVQVDSSSGSHVSISRNRDNLINLIELEDSKVNLEYDSHRNLTSISFPGKQKVTIFHDSKTFTHRITRVNLFGKVYSFGYELMGRLSSINQDTGKLEFTYGKNVIQFLAGNGRHIMQIQKEGHFQFERNSDVYFCSYDDKGKLNAFRKNESSIYFQYDDKGNLISEKIGTDVYQYFYDPEYNILQKVMKNNNIVTQKEIINGLVISEFIEGTGEVKYNYDIDRSINTLTLEKIGSFKFTKDTFGNISEIHHSNGQISRLIWKNNHLFTYQDIFGSHFKFNFNSSGKLIEIIHPIGNSNFRNDTFYNASAFLSPLYSGTLHIKDVDYSDHTFKVKTEEGENISFKIDKLRRIIKISEEGSSVERRYSYNEDNKLESIKLNNGSEIKVETNEKGQITNYITSDGAWSRIGYNKNHLVESIIMDKDLRKFEYDQQNRLTNIAINTVIKYNFQYHPTYSEKIQSIEYPDKAKLLYTYDTKGRIKTVSFQNSKPFIFEYSDDMSNEIVYPNGMVHTEQLDDKGLITQLNVMDSQGQSLISSNFFFKDGKMVAGSDNGRRITFSYDENKKISEYSIHSLGSFVYTYDNHYNLTSFSTPNKASKKYEYDSKFNTLAIIDSSKNVPLNSINLIGRISGAKFNFLEINGLGQNLEEKSEVFKIKNFAVNPEVNVLNFKGFLTSGNVVSQNLKFYVHPEANAVYQFNEAGQLKYLFRDGLYEKYEWTAFNQLKDFTTSDGKTYEYIYLPNGEVASTTHDRTILFSYDPYGNLIEEIASTGRSIIKYFYDYQTNRLIGSFDGKQIRFYHTDAFGSVINITDSAGTSNAEYTYSPFGQISYKNEKIQNNIGFLGMRKTSETGCYISKFGYYDPENVIFFPTFYNRVWKNIKALDMNINQHILPLPAKFVSLTNPVLEPVPVPNTISFNRELLWIDYLKNLPKDLKQLRSYLKN